MAGEANENGSDGVAINQVTGYKVTVVGMNPNVYPSCRKDEGGTSKIKYVVGESQGSIKTKTAIPKYESIETAADWHTGDYNIVAANVFTVESGSGGIVLETTGNISLHGMGGMVSIVAPASLVIGTELVSLNSINGTYIRGGELQVKTTSTFEKNMSVGGNLHVVGGAYVNGELFVNHITAQQQTQASSATDGTGSINPAASFTVIDGDALLSEFLKGTGNVTLYIPLIALKAIADAIKDYILNGGALPETGIPISVDFPKGISLISDSNVSQVFPIDLLEPEPDVIIDYHSHEVSVPSCTLKDSTAGVWEAATAINKDENVDADPMQFNGMGLQEFMKEEMDVLKKKATDKLKKKMWTPIKAKLKKILPF